MEKHKTATPATPGRHNQVEESEYCHLKVTPRGLSAGFRLFLVKSKITKQIKSISFQENMNRTKQHKKEGRIIGKPVIENDGYHALLRRSQDRVGCSQRWAITSRAWHLLWTVPS